MPSEGKNSIRFASINIEFDMHLETVVDFLKNFKPDVVCFQELTLPRVQFFEKALGMKGHFLPMAKFNIFPRDKTTPVEVYGLGLYTSLPVSDVRSGYYYGGSGDVPLLVSGDETTLWRGFLQMRVEKVAEFFTLATTHFTRTADGSTSDKQRQDLEKFLGLLQQTPELILCGDFNAPRGGEIFTALAKHFKDNIPEYYESSLDPKLHTVGHLKLMVDGLFSTPGYQVMEATLSEGVSDHKAVTALISRVFPGR